tara:strand:+ start:4336 stop:6327 length:1992 start_codon:yes stop_codon:yes gene_type:complete
MAGKKKRRRFDAQGFIWTDANISAIQQVSAGTGVPEDILAGLMVIESSGKPTAQAANPRFIWGIPASKSVRSRLAGTKAAAHAAGRVRRKDGTVIKSAHGGGARKVFNEVYAVSPYWAVRICAWGYFQVLGKFAMRGYGGPPSGDAASAKAFLDHFRSDPHAASIKAAISWWNNQKYSAEKKKFANDRNYAKTTEGYYGGYKKSYAQKLEKYSGQWRRRHGTKGGKAVAAAPSANRRIALIGDSNAKHLNGMYASYFSGNKTLQVAPAVGAGADWFLALLRAVEAKDPSKAFPIRGGKEKAKQLIDFNPEIIHITSLGGNNANQGGSPATLDAWAKKHVRPLFQLVKKYNGTVSGAVTIDPNLVKTYKGAVVDIKKYNASSWQELRSRVNDTMAKVASEVGISFWNPYSTKSYELRPKGKGYDGAHMTRKMASAEFASRAGMLGGSSVYSGGSYVAGMDSVGGASAAAAAPGEDYAYYDPRANDGKGGMVHPGERGYVRQQRTAAEIAQRKELEAGMMTALQALALRGGTHRTISNKDMEAALEKLKKKQNAPPPEKLAVVGGDDEVPLGPGKKGRILQKYVPILKKHQPDFDFDKFYSEVDKLAPLVAEKILPKHGRDYVFGDEHWDAFVVVRDIKDEEHAKVVAESFGYLRKLVSEVKRKW